MGHARAMAFREYFPDFRTEVIGLMDFGDVVVSRVVFCGTYAGGWVGVDSAGATTEVSGVDVFLFKDGLVFEHWHEADHELMWEQHCGATQESSAVDLPPHIDTSGTRNDLAECFALHAQVRTRVVAETRKLEDVNDCFEEVLAGKVPARPVFDLT